MNLSHGQGPGETGPPRLLFGDFELQLDSGELRRTGLLVKLQPQPAKILEILARRSGEVVSREEIRRLVWGDSYVDSDASLNFCIKEIRRALGDSATRPSYIETVPRRGYRFLKPVKLVPEAGEPSAKLARPTLPVQLRLRRSRLGTVSASLALLVLLTLLVGSRIGHVASRPRLAVLPLGCRGQEPADRQVCGGITEALTAELARQFPRDLDVIAASSVLAYRSKSAAETGHRLRADYILTGEALLDHRGLELRVRLSRLGWGKSGGLECFPGELKDAPRIYKQIARDVARQLDLRLPPLTKAQAARSVSGSNRSSPAYEAYLRGVYLQRHEQAEKAAATFQEAILLDPGFAAAYAALAEARLQLQPPADLGATEAAARRALAQDPDLAEAHLVLGKILLRHYRDWQSAGRELRTALALAPESADAHHEYSLYLAALGRHAEAIASVGRARELDPASMLVGSDYAWYFYLDHRYEEAIRQGKIALNLFPLSADTAPMAAKAGRFYCEETILNSAWALGDHETALEAAKAIQGFFKPSQEAARLRDVNEFWHAREDRIEAVQPTRLLDPFVRAKNAMSLGDRDRALDLLTQACAPPGMWMPFAAVEPVFDPLHSDPRWSQVLDCLKLPADAPARHTLANRKL